MRIIKNVGGVLLLMVGGIWFLQGIGALPGSFMSGQTEWAVYGGAAATTGLVLLITANRRRPER